MNGDRRGTGARAGRRLDRMAGLALVDYAGWRRTARADRAALVASVNNASTALVNLPRHVLRSLPGGRDLCRGRAREVHGRAAIRRLGKVRMGGGKR